MVPVQRELFRLKFLVKERCSQQASSRMGTDFSGASHARGFTRKRTRKGSASGRNMGVSSRK